MSTRLNLWLSAPHAAWLDPADTPLVLATLLVCMNRHDALAGQLCTGQIDAILALRYDLTLAEAADLRLASETCAKAAPQMETLAGMIRVHVPRSELIALGLCLCTVLRGCETGHRDGKFSHGVVGHILGIDALTLVQADFS